MRHIFFCLLLLLSINTIQIISEETLGQTQTQQEQNFDANAQIVLTLKDVEYLQNCTDQQVYLSRQLINALKTIDATQLAHESKLLLMINACNSNCKFMPLEQAQQALQEATGLLKENKLDQSLQQAINDYKASLENKDAYITFEVESDDITRAASGCAQQQSNCIKQQFVCSLLVQDLTVCRSFRVQGPNATSAAFEVSIPENEATFRVPVQINGNLSVNGIIRSRGQRVVTNAANIGAGSGQIFANKSAGVLNFRTLEAGSNVTITTNTDTVTIASTSGGGDVFGPASSTDNAIARYDGTTGKIIQNSGVTIDDSNNVSTPGNLNLETNPSTASAGNITKGSGTLFIHNLGSITNTFVGLNAGDSVTTGVNNSALGQNTLTNNTTGSSNTAIGVNALQANNGSQNTALGDNALNANTTGERNTAIGFATLDSSTTGVDNTAVGANALGAATIDANQNTAIGSTSLDTLTTGDGNTAVGYNTLGAITTQVQNTAVGLNALAANIASGNTAFGSQALTANTSGIANTACGFGAIISNTTGSNNSAFGDSALGNPGMNSSNNTALGASSLLSNTTGNNNIGIGTNGGSSLTTGSNNIDIGNTGVAGESNTIRIGTDPGAGTRKTFIANIRGITTDNANAVAVLIDSAGQLGTVSSSSRYKNNINDINDKSNALMQLRPVRFNYNEDKTNTTQYGLIAEEVHNVMPELVVYDEENRPETVKYHLLTPLLLNELKKLRSEFEQYKLTHP